MTRIALHAPADGWILPIEDVPDPVFAQRMMGDGMALDPLADTITAPVAGIVSDIHRALHAVTIQVEGGPSILIHCGLETVALDGEGFACLVTKGQRVAPGTPLIRMDLNRVAVKARSLVTPIVLADSGGYRIADRIAAGMVRGGDLLCHLEQAASAEDRHDAAVPAVALTSPAVRNLRVPLRHGLHARPCARLAAIAKSFDAEATITAPTGRARVRSPSAVLALGIELGDAVTLEAGGEQAEAAVEALAAAIEKGMGEKAPLPSMSTTSARASTPGHEAISGAPASIATGTVLQGVPAAAGIALGAAWIMQPPRPDLDESVSDPVEERARFGRALAAMQAELERDDDAGDAAGAVAQAHLALLLDEDVLSEVHAAIAAGSGAARAWEAAMRARADAMSATGNPLFAERAQDFLDLEQRMQWQIAERPMPAATVPVGAIVLADDLLPSDIAALDPALVGGVAMARGGPTSHVAIIAASRGIPMLVAAGPALLAIAPGTTLALDAGHGQLTVAPAPDVVEAIEAAMARREARRAAAATSLHEEGRTLDGERIEIFANLGSRSDAVGVLDSGAEGCGLLRSEFLFLDRAEEPDEDEQAAEYEAVARALDGRPLIVRLLDVGGDKPAPYLPIAAEENPALGLRGIRVGLAHPRVLATQLRAILRAAARLGSDGDLRIMVPMVARLEELRAVRTLLRAEADTLNHANVPPLGIMVETPAAAVTADMLAAECDFVSIGTNDLTQYVLAMDRGNPAVAAGIDALDPAVLRFVDLCCRGAARHRVPVGMCGGLAADPLAIPALIGLGVSELSMPPAAIADAKAVVRAASAAACRDLAGAVLQCDDRAGVRALLRDFAGETGR